MTSRAWTESSGTSFRWPDSASSSIWRLTTDTHCRDTLKVWSFPSPGRVTSRSTWGGCRNTHLGSKIKAKVHKQVNRRSEASDWEAQKWSYRSQKLPDRLFWPQRSCWWLSAAVSLSVYWLRSRTSTELACVHQWCDVPYQGLEVCGE